MPRKPQKCYHLNMRKTYLLTGGTGFLGSRLSFELIKRGNRVIFLGRSKNGQGIKSRIEGVLKELGCYQANTEAIEIDIERDDLGIPSEITQQLAGNVDGIWHLAANMSFKEDDRDRLFATNIQGVNHVLRLASKIGSPVYYTSTAYIHGKRKQKVAFEEETLDIPRIFNNSYEESKFKSEKLLHEWGDQNGNNFIIFRPSIFVARDKSILNFYGYYAVVLALFKLKQNLLRAQNLNQFTTRLLRVKVANNIVKIFIPFFYSNTSSLNLMPIDLAVDWMIKISSDPLCKGKTFHIVNPVAFPMRSVTEQTFSAVGVEVPLLGTSSLFAYLYYSLICRMCAIKVLRPLSERLRFYKNYMVGNTTYEMSNTSNALGADLETLFNLPPNFIENIARDFIKKLVAHKKNEIR